MSKSMRNINIIYFVMLLPAVIYMILFNYLPMFGSIIAFKNYKYAKGIFGSEWIGFENFKGFFTSSDAFLTIRNTVTFGRIGKRVFRYGS